MVLGVDGHDRAQQWSLAALEDRVVRYRDLEPCTNAFIDTRTPGSDTKENFTIIGPGVAENPEQHVHIKEPHGFNIGWRPSASAMHQFTTQPRYGRGFRRA